MTIGRMTPRSLPILGLFALLAACASRSPALQGEDWGEPFSEYSVCPAQWALLVDEWAAGPASGTLTLDELHETTRRNDDTRLGAALRKAWALEGQHTRRDQFPTEAQVVFVEELAPFLRGDCQSLGWLAVALSSYPPGHWPMTLRAADERRQLQPGDEQRAMRFIRDLVDHPHLEP